MKDLNMEIKEKSGKSAEAAMIIWVILHGQQCRIFRKILCTCSQANLKIGQFPVH